MISFKTGKKIKRPLLSFQEIGLLFLCVTSAVGCTWVRMSDSGAEVRLITKNTAQNCQRIGKTTATTPQKVLLNRKEVKVKAELQTLAQNEAARMGGNAIRADNETNNGKQTFTVFRCSKN